jgi:hypothetical protein
MKHVNNTWRSNALTALCLGAAFLTSGLRAPASPSLTLWDTSTPLTSAAADRASWKTVPRDLLLLESKPATAESDPGYYGREYVFKGDAIVEGPNLSAAFLSRKGRVDLYFTGATSKFAEICPMETRDKTVSITRVSILHNTDDELALEAAFSSQGAPEISETFVFDSHGIVEIKPSQSSKGVSISAMISHGIVPNFIGDDLIYGGNEFPPGKSLSIPSENFFVGLLQGEESELVVTWPKGKQQVTLRAGNEQEGDRPFESIDFANDSQSLFLSALKAPGIWHRETLKPDYLEKDVASQWKRPFPARWKTQLIESDVKTSFTFKETRGDIWRGVPGSYIYPVWFDGDTAMFHLSKKVPPKGESLIYCLEPQDSPLITTPVDILKETLGRSISDSMLDLDGRMLRTHHRRGGDGVRRACTCGCTEAIQAIFEAHDEVAKTQYVAGAVDDMIYFVHCHVERIGEYRAFVDQLIPFLETNATTHPDLKPYLDNLEQIARQIPKEYTAQHENMKSFAYADELAHQTLALTAKSDPDNLKTYMGLLESWRGMGGAQDYVLAQCHIITRKLFQAAGYGCADQPEATPLAEEIMARSRQCLRNPDGYEIWADY